MAASCCSLNQMFCPPPLFNHRKTRLSSQRRSASFRVAAFFDLREEPIVKEALKEPIAFLGGVFAGLLRLDLNEEPLKGWIEKTSKAAKLEESGDEPEQIQEAEGGPEEIQID